MARLRPTGMTQAQVNSRNAAAEELNRKQRIVEKLREQGFVECDDLHVLAYAIRDLYRKAGIEVPVQLREWWDAFRAAEAEIATEENGQ